MAMMMVGRSRRKKKGTTRCGDAAGRSAGKKGQAAHHSQRLLALLGLCKQAE